MKKILMISLIAVVLLILGCGIWFFFIGQPVDGNTLVIDVSETENQINIFATTPSSAIAFTDVQFRQTDTVLHISFRKVPVTRLYSSGQKSIYIEKTDLTEIWLGGRQIWTN